MVTAWHGKDRARGAASSCLGCFPSIREAVGVDGSSKEAKVGCEASMQVCRIKSDHGTVINREVIEAIVDVWEIKHRKDYDPVQLEEKWTTT